MTRVPISTITSSPMSPIAGHSHPCLQTPTMVARYAEGETPIPSTKTWKRTGFLEVETGDLATNKSEQAERAAISRRAEGTPRSSNSTGLERRRRSQNGLYSRLFVKKIQAMDRGNWQRVLEELDEAEHEALLTSKGLDFWHGDFCVTVSMYAACISKMAEMRRWREALAILKRMRAVGVSPNQYAMISAVVACAKSGQTQIMLNLIDQMFKSGMTPSVRCLSMAMDALTADSNVDGALNLFDRATRAGVQSDTVVYKAVIRACGKGGQLKRTLGMIERARRHGTRMSLELYNMAITACGRCNGWREALDLFHEMKTAGPTPNAVTYTAAIVACGQCGQWEPALSLLREMQAIGMREEIAYNGAMTACARSGEWRRAIGLLRETLTPGTRLRPNQFLFSAAITACGNGGQWKLACALLREMPKVMPDDRGLDGEQTCGDAFHRTPCEKQGEDNLRHDPVPDSSR